MEIKEENIYKKQEDLSIVVEPLVDSISELVLSSVNGSFENVQSCCIDIAERTNKLVLVAQQTAVSSLDVDLQMEVAVIFNPFFFFNKKNIYIYYRMELIKLLKLLKI